MTDRAGESHRKKNSNDRNGEKYPLKAKLEAQKLKQKKRKMNMKFHSSCIQDQTEILMV